MREKKHYQVIKRLHEAQGDSAYLLDVFGDTIAQRENYKSINGIDAIHFYIVHKFKWLPSVVKSMSAEDLRFVLSEEMSNWTAPKEAL
jgi:hypothetical protein